MLTRRDFLKGILATAGAVALKGPLALIEPIHGAHELTAQERDVVADVLGIRRQVWPIAKPRLKVHRLQAQLQSNSELQGDAVISCGSARLWMREKERQSWEALGEVESLLGYPVEMVAGPNVEIELELGNITGYIVPTEFRADVVKEYGKLIARLPPLSFTGSWEPVKAAITRTELPGGHGSIGTFWDLTPQWRGDHR